MRKRKRRRKKRKRKKRRMKRMRMRMKRRRMRMKRTAWTKDGTGMRQHKVQSRLILKGRY